MNVNNFTSKDELQKYVTAKSEKSQLFQETLLESELYPCGILIRNGNKNYILSRKIYKTFLEYSKEVLNQKHFPHLYKKDGSINYRSLGKGFLIPVHKSLNVETILHSLRQINFNSNLGLKIEKSKDGPCEDGRNIITEWKHLPPNINTENASKFFSDFGVLIEARDSEEEGIFVTFSSILDTLPLSSLMNPHISKGGKWFYVFKNRPIQCRFVSSLSCSNCQIQGHHHSRCPEGLSEVIRQYNKLISGDISSTSSSKSNQNQKGTIKVSKTNPKKSAKQQTSNSDAKDQMFISPVDSGSGGKKRRIQKRNLESPPFMVGSKPQGLLHDSSPSSTLVKGTGSGLGSNLMDTSLDMQLSSDLTKRHDEVQIVSEASGIGLTKGSPNVSIDVNNFFGSFKDTQKQNK